MGGRVEGGRRGGVEGGREQQLSFPFITRTRFLFRLPLTRLTRLTPPHPSRPSFLPPTIQAANQPSLIKPMIDSQRGEKKKTQLEH